MLSANQREIAHREKIELLSPYEARLREYRNRLDEYYETRHLNSNSELGKFIHTHREIITSILNSFYFNDVPYAAIYLNEATLKMQCAYYDQLIQAMARKDREIEIRARLRGQFDYRVQAYIRRFEEYMAICSLKERDPREHERIQAYIEHLKNILNMLRDDNALLYTDETTLSKDCAHLDELIQTVVIPKIAEAQVLREQLRIQFKDRMAGLIEHLSDELKKPPQEERRKNRINYWIKDIRPHYYNLVSDFAPIFDSTELNAVCTKAEVGLKREQLRIQFKDRMAGLIEHLSDELKNPLSSENAKNQINSLLIPLRNHYDTLIDNLAPTFELDSTKLNNLCTEIEEKYPLPDQQEKSSIRLRR